MTTPPTPDPLDRLFTTLVATIRDERPEYLGGSFEVGELLAFVPYKKVRAALGVELGGSIMSIDPAAAREGLLALWGIGPWTADYVLLRAMRDPDVLLVGDLVK